MNLLKELISNQSFWAGFLSWLVAQSAKLISNLIITRKFDFKYFVSLGGMPSAHSAAVSGLAISVGLQCGWDTPVFAVGLGLAGVTVFDASTVRRAAGMQARLLNEMVDQLFKDHHFSHDKLRELLGHTRLEVFMGIVIGILVAVIVNSFSVFI